MAVAKKQRPRAGPALGSAPACVCSPAARPWPQDHIGGPPMQAGGPQACRPHPDPSSSLTLTAQLWGRIWGTSQAKGSTKLLPQTPPSTGLGSAKWGPWAGPWRPAPPLPQEPGVGRLREGPNALGRVADVPDLDVGGGHGEHEPRVAAVLDGDHVVGVALQSGDFLPGDQVPHLTASVCERWTE